MTTADAVFRDYVTDGVPSSGANKPKKSEIRALLNGMTTGGGDGIYDFIPASNTGAGTANALKATTAVALPTAPNGALVAVNVYEDNTATPVTVQFNGGTIYTIKTNSGNDVSVGGLKEGSIAAGYLSGTTFRLLSDEASAAIVTAAEAAQAAAEAARDEAVGAVPSLIMNSIAALRSFAATSSAAVVDVIGYFAGSSVGGGEFWYDASDTDTPDDGGTVAVDGLLRRWKRRFTSTRPEYWGAIGYRESIGDFKARLAAGTALDDYIAIQKAIDYLESKGGGTLKLSRFHKSNTPPVVPYGVSIKGPGRNSCGIYKDSTTTTAVTYYDTAATPQTTIYPGALPTAANAVLILGKAYGNGRWVGKLQGFSLGSTFATDGDYESQKAEFGILSIGSISDFVIDDLVIDNCQYGMLIPTPFVGRITNNRANNCLHAFGIGNCTTLTYRNNYANDCRDYGHVVRGGKYSTFSNNACDFLNDPALYPDRTRECSAYIADSCVGVNFINNGQEGTWGNGWVMDSLRYCKIENNLSLRIGSDYVGTADIAVWKAKTALVGCVVEGNNAYDVKTEGLISGGANAAKHHNNFAEAGTYLNGTTWHNNVVRAAFSGLDTEAGWLNNNIQEAVVIKRGGIFAGTDRNSIYRALFKGMGNTASTRGLGVLNSDDTTTFAVRDDGNVGFPAIGSSAAAANAVFDASNFIFKSTSLRSAKTNIESLPLNDAMQFMEMDAKLYTSLCKADDPSQIMAGFLADDAEDYAKPLAVYDKDGQLQGFAYDRAPAYHHVVLQHLLAEIESLKAKLN